ncbi:MAG: hypothetical protein R3D65_09075 [Zhengella sp.]|uniref:hypothetical protein n=1 Tax=Zhengella sp. TaxID=2282762 RepID=UPI001DFBDC3D|nr:hypothetical protein [Notoacmeibacter sp.]MCC0025491.1 hypothetical protein [Brucellaceae bacterium]
MSQPARSRAHDDFVAFDTEAAETAPFVPLSQEEEHGDWQPLFPSADDGTQDLAAPDDPFAGMAVGTPDFPDFAPPSELPGPGLCPQDDGAAGAAFAGAGFPAMAGGSDDFAAFSAFTAEESLAEEPLALDRADTGPEAEPFPADAAMPAALDGAVEAGDGDAAPQDADGEAADGQESDGYGFVSAAAGTAESRAERQAQARLLADQLATGLERISVELAEQVSASVGRILEPVVSQAVRERMTDRFLKAATEALAMRPESPCRLEAPHALVEMLRAQMEERGFNIDIVAGRDDGLTLRLDTQVLAARFSGLAARSGVAGDE